MSELKLLLEKDGPLGWIIFNQPEKRNAVSQEMWQLMPDYIQDLETDDAIRVSSSMVLVNAPLWLGRIFRNSKIAVAMPPMKLNTARFRRVARRV